jgi:phosphate transport system substrate-binding protein
MFKKIITAAASAAVVAGVLLAAPANADGVTLNGGGSSFAAGAIKACAADYKTNTVNYTTSSSGTGRTSYANSTFDYAAADSTFGSEVFSGANNTRYAVVPLLGGPVVFAYSAVGVNDGLKLTPEIVSGIFKGTITKWNDAALKAQNPKVKLPNKSIKVAYRTSGSGTTENLTNYLSQVLDTDPTSVNNSGWIKAKDLPGAVGVASVTYLDSDGKFVSSTKSTSDANFQAGKVVVVQTGKSNSVTSVSGNGEFASNSASFGTSSLLKDYIEDTANAFGYFDLSDAMGADVGIAALQNKANAFVMPTVSAAAKFINAQTPSTDSSDKLNGTLVIDFTKVVAGAYQLSIVTYGIAPRKGATATTPRASAIQDFFNYVVKTCIPAKAATLGYVAIGGALKTSALSQIKVIG